MIAKEEYERWKEHKVSKAFFEFILHAQKQWEDNFMSSTPHIQNIGLMGSLQGRIELCKDLQIDELYESMNNVLDSGDKQDGNRD